MPWCPKCRRFQEENDLCSRCWVELVDSLPPELPVEKEAFLVSVGDVNEATMIQSLLESSGIHSVRRYRESGGYMKVYMETTVFGIDIYVAESNLETAREILESDIDSSSDILEEDQEDVIGGQILKRQDAARIMLMFVLVPILIGVFITAIEVFINR